MNYIFHAIFLIYLSLMAPITLCDEEPQIDQLIQTMFPKATVIGDKTADPAAPLRPVYQLNEIIGYAFESNDLVDLPGFSGERINLLIGIDTQGTFTGVSLLHHHEPIFMHGLGPKPLLEFLRQYEQHSVADRFIVGRKKGHTNTGATYLDGVTKATVSVIVANDTILNAALKVARSKLAEFAQQPPATIKFDHLENMSWPTLLSSELVRHWTIDRSTVETALDGSLNDYPTQRLNLTNETLDKDTPDDKTGKNKIELYYAYLNPPTIGQNLLGGHEYQQLMARLKPGEHAFAIMSEGFYSYLKDDFKPGTVPAHISLVQHGLPISIRDTNFYEMGALSLMTGAPKLDNLHIFRIRPQAGFDPSAPMQLQLIIELAKNHLITDRVSFDDDYTLPARFFDVVKVENTEQNTELWVRIWQSRSGQIIILLIALALLTIAFIKQHKLTRQHKFFHRFRWAFLIFTLLFIGFYAQGQLSVVNIFTVLLGLRNDFDIGVFLLDPIIFILWVYTFISLFLFGRGLFCGWLCPFGALQEMLSWLSKRLGLKQVNIPNALHRRLLKVKYLLLFSLLGLCFYSLNYAEKAAEIEPFKTAITLTFIRYWPFVVYAVLLLGIGLYIHKFYCRYVCPLGAGLAILGHFKLFEWLTRRKECGSPCQLCHHRCEIDAIKKTGEIDYDECIQCLECIVIINDPQQCAPAKVALKKSAIRSN